MCMEGCGWGCRCLEGCGWDVGVWRGVGGGVGVSVEGCGGCRCVCVWRGGVMSKFAIKGLVVPLIFF